MSEKAASLLTKTQRRRLADDFEDVEGAKRRRDQRQIRTRVAAGLDDFEYLVGYPDDQFELALEALDDEDVERTVAELYVVAERLRGVRDLDREAVVERARTVAADEGIDRPDLRTRAERRASVADDLEPSRWKRRSDLLLEVGLLLLVPALALGVVRPALASGPVGGVPGLLGAVALLAGLSIVGVHGLKNDLVPAVRALVSDPTGSIRSAWERI